MDWLKENDRREGEESEHQRTVEPEECQYSLLTSSSNHNRIANVNDCNLINLCYDTNKLTSDREGIEGTPIIMPGAEGESSSLVEIHSRSLNFSN